MTNTEALTPSSPSLKEGMHLWMEWGYSRTHIATHIKNAVPDMTLFSSPRQPIAGTEVIPFPVANTPEAIDEINEAIEKYNIDVVWPQSSAHYDLSALNAEVHTAASPEVIRLVDDKMAFNEWLRDDPYRPLSVEAVGVDAIHHAFLQLSEQAEEVCIKPAIGVAGNGYWHLAKDTQPSFLDKPENHIIHPEVYLQAMALEEVRKGPQRMVVMEYLPGPEISVDLLTWRGEPLIHAARTKIDFATSQRIQSEHEVLEHSRSIASKLGFHGIVSMQYRLDTDGKWKMLEINPRPAGGSTHSEAAGFGIISNWARLVARTIEPDEVKQYHADVTLTFGRSWTLEN